MGAALNGKDYVVSIEKSSQAVFISDLDGTIIDFNQKFMELVGFSENELFIKDISQIHLDHQSVKSLKENWIKNPIEKPLKTIDGFLITSTGEKINVTLESIPLESENQKLVAIIIIDISNNKKTEELLEESESKYKTLFNSNPGYITCFDNNGKLIEVNEAVKTDLGDNLEIIREVSLEGIGTFQLGRDDLNSNDFTSKQILEQMIGLSSKKHVIGKILLKTGETRCYHCYVVPLRANGNLIGYQGIGRDITEILLVENELQKSIQEKETLLREVHHRVKNNLQIISSLHNMRRSFVKEQETIDVLKDSQTRIKALASIHEKLYQSTDLTHISIRDYVESLVYDLFYVYNISKEQISLIIEIDDLNLNLETAMPCGLIINELTANSLKYAFPNGKKGTFIVRLESVGESIHLTISDNGVGLSKKTYLNDETLGFQLIKSLTDQLNGQIEMDNSQGTKFDIIFKEADYKKRIL